MISVVCPIFNEEKYIDKCISSLLEQDFPREEMEVLFIDGLSNDRTKDIVHEYMKKHSFIHLFDNPYKIVPYAMNIGIHEAKGDIIIRIDAHSSYASNYFSVLVKNLIELNADNVGAVCKTDVLNITKKTLAIKEVLANKFGVGNSIFRTGVDKAMEVDTVPFGCWKRDVFDRFGLYDIRLVRNQDIELNKRILRGGGKIFIVPDTYCTYFARETLKEIAQNNYQNGKWNILTVFYTKQFNSLSIRHFIPMCFVLSFIIPSLLALFYLPFILISVVSLILYVSLLIYISIDISLKKRISFIYLMCSFLTLHLAYGFGSLKAFFCLFFNFNILSKKKS